MTHVTRIKCKLDVGAVAIHIANCQQCKEWWVLYGNLCFEETEDGAVQHIEPSRVIIEANALEVKPETP